MHNYITVYPFPLARPSANLFRKIHMLINILNMCTRFVNICRRYNYTQNVCNNYVQRRVCVYIYIYAKYENIHMYIKVYPLLWVRPPANLFSNIANNQTCANICNTYVNIYKMRNKKNVHNYINRYLNMINIRFLQFGVPGPIPLNPARNVMPFAVTDAQSLRMCTTSPF